MMGKFGSGGAVSYRGMLFGIDTFVQWPILEISKC